MNARLAAYALAGFGFLGVGATLTTDAPTYRRDIAPVFANKCASCHKPGGAGPFKLLEYKDVRKHGDLIDIVTVLQKMPPMDATSDYGEIPLHPKLTDEEVLKIQEWLRTGMAEGEGTVPPANDQPDWPLGPPTTVVQVGPVTVPPEGNQAVKEIVVPLNIDSERDLIGFDVHPRSPKTARQFVLALLHPGESSPFRPGGIRAESLIGTWAIGYRPWRLPDDASIRVKPGDRLCFRLLYHPSGRSEDGGFDLALYYGDKPRPRHPKWVTIGRNNFEIAGGEPYFTDLDASTSLDSPAEVVTLLPEARYYATHVSVTAKTPSEGERTLLNIKRWDQRWVGAYNFETPPLLPAGTTLLSEFQYRNSNHDDTSLTVDQVKRLPPNQPVHYGPKDTDELFWLHVQLLPKP